MRNGEKTLRHLLKPIQGLLDDPSVTEIVVQQPGEVGYERGGKWGWRTALDLTFERLDAIGILASSLLSKRFDRDHPICLTELPDGHRLTLCGPPVTAPGTISLTIRIPSQDKHTMWESRFKELVEHSNTQSEDNPVDSELLRLYRAKDWPDFYSLAIRSKKTIVATGATKSGKTSFLKTIMQDIPPTERLITIEDTDEFKELPVRNRVSMFFGSANVTAEDCVQATLRMGPDRVVMQELLGVEAFAYIRLLATGRPGGLTTWHAEDGDPFTPLAFMVKKSDEGRSIPDPKLLAFLRRQIDIVVHCHSDGVQFSIPSVWFRAAEDDQK